MILCLDVGNSQIYGGVFEEGELKVQFRRTSRLRSSSDELGVFFRAVLRENHVDPGNLHRIAISCVVPDLLYSLRACCQKYFGIEPVILRPDVKTGLTICYHDPGEVGADRIADAIGATTLYPGRNVIVVDFGTATTICAITKNREFLGGNIIPGVQLSMQALEERTAQLPSVEILPPDTAIGKSTRESIQSGLYWGNVGIVRELVNRITDEAFSGVRPLVIGTGGFAHLFDREDLFDRVIPDLILVGLLKVLELNE